MGIAKIITIDGPAASGKSTLGKNLAEKMGYFFFDTGVMYRAVTWLALQHHIDLHDEAGLARLADEMDIDVRPPSHKDGRTYDAIIGGEDCTWNLRLPEVDANVSVVSAFPAVRKALTAQQRKIALRGNVVMVGRDIGTVVLPDADLKIFLDASVEERARRRYTEMIARGEPADLNEILSAMRERDRIDSTRQVAPLKPADDAVILSSEGLEADETLEKVLKIVYCSDR